MHMGQMTAGQTTARRAKTSRYAILGGLSRRPLSGYDVKKLIERAIAHFLSESYGQIYPILKPLPPQGPPQPPRGGGGRQPGRPPRCGQHRGGRVLGWCDEPLTPLNRRGARAAPRTGRG